MGHHVGVDDRCDQIAVQTSHVHPEPYAERSSELDAEQSAHGVPMQFERKGEGRSRQGGGGAQRARRVRSQRIGTKNPSCNWTTTGSFPRVAEQKIRQKKPPPNSFFFLPSPSPKIICTPRLSPRPKKVTNRGLPSLVCFVPPSPVVCSVQRPSASAVRAPTARPPQTILRFQLFREGERRERMKLCLFCQTFPAPPRPPCMPPLSRFESLERFAGQKQ